MTTGPLGPGRAQPTRNGPVLVTGGRLVHGPAERVTDDGAVLFADGVIRAAGPRAQVDALAGPGTTRHDHPGSTILPGLVDAHVHLAFDCSEDPRAALASVDPDELTRAMARRAGALLSCGVTTARDLGDASRRTLDLRDAIARGELPGPRLLAATTPLTPPGGHCWFLGGEVAGPAGIAALVDANAAAGADLIKVMASGGALTRGAPPMWAAQFDRDELTVVVDRARRHRLSVAAHAHGTATIADCVAAGVATIEHCSWRTEDGLVYDEPTAREIAARGIAVCRCISGDWHDFLTRLGPNAEPLVGSVRRMRAAGVRFVAGTDAGVPGARFDDYVGMLGFFVHIGFDVPEVLDMAMAGAAAGLGLTDTGVLEEGRRADLLVVDGDPLTDLGALRAPRLVVAGGRVYPGAR